MTLQFLHGIETIEVPSGLRPIQTVRSAVIGIVGTAPDADPELFPLNEPVLIAGNPYIAQSLGLDGTLPDAISAFFKVCRPTIIVVRVDEGSTADQTLGNVLGSSVQLTGLHALRKARSKLGFGPRLIVTPGFTVQRPTTGVKSVTVGAGGTGYSADSVVTFTGTGTGAKGRVNVNEAGQITSIAVTSPGVGYTAPPTVTVTGGTGANLTAVLGKGANPIAAELIGILPMLRAYAFVNSGALTYAEAIEYRQSLSSNRLMVIDGNARVTASFNGQAFTMPSAPFAAALQALVDQTDGFWHSFSNRVVPGIVGIDRAIEWSYFDPNVEGQLLNSQQITVLVQDEGYRFMGLRSAVSTGDWQFMSVRRTADMVYESIEQAMRDIVGKPISIALLDFIESSGNAYIRQLVRRGALIGGEFWLDRELNTPADLVAGHVTMDYDLEPPAPLERLTFRARRNPEYYEELVEEFLRS